MLLSTLWSGIQLPGIAKFFNNSESVDAELSTSYTGFQYIQCISLRWHAVSAKMNVCVPYHLVNLF